MSKKATRSRSSTTKSLSSVEVHFDGGVATLRLARPEARNALSIEMCGQIVEALSEIDANEAARVVILSGEGSTFCAGADFAAVSGPAGLEFLPAFERMLAAVARFRLPVLAQIQGAALGGGFQLATCCDFRIVADDAKLGIPSSRLGIVINLENVERLVALAGAPLAREILMTGANIAPDRALRGGIVTKVCSAAELEAETLTLARSIAVLAPLSVQGAKRTIGAISSALSSLRSHSPDEANAIDELVAEGYRSSDLQEGLRAMGEKRSPEFRGE